LIINPKEAGQLFAPWQIVLMGSFGKILNCLLKQTSFEFPWICTDFQGFNV